MTRGPTVVSVDDSAMDALGLMIDNHFRHLPVVDSTGRICGLLDIGKCLDDAISKLERSLKKKTNQSNTAEYLNQVASMQGADVNKLATLLGPILAKAFNDTTSPTLDSLLTGKPANATAVSPKSSILDAAIVMAEHRKAALVVDKGQLLGIVTSKDIMNRAVAGELPLQTTDVTEIMTSDPEFVTPKTTIVEALQVMHDNKFLTLPVCDDDGMICGVIDVMDLIHGCGGADGWRSIFDNAMDMDDLSDQNSAHSSVHSSHIAMPVFAQNKADPVIHVTPLSPYATAQLNKVPNQVEFTNGGEDSIADSMLDRTLSYTADPNSNSVASPGRTSKSIGEIAFKVVDDEGQTYVIRNDGNYDNFIKALSLKLNKVIDPKMIQLKYIDEEGDSILISSDDCLGEALAVAHKKGAKTMKINLSIQGKGFSSVGTDSKMLAIAGGGVAVLIGIAAMIMMKAKK